ncbi:MAG: hypothetical protein U1E05_12175, partial [Patescibacteria group bacterium]|nr:hypothetical protein [Patescibacteria group bacterium]
DEGLMQPTLAPGVRLLAAGDLSPASVEAYRTMAWLDDLATSRRTRSNSSMQVQAVDEALKVYWS